MWTLRVTAFGVLLTLAHANFSLRILTTSDQVVTGVSPNSVILNVPPCRLAGQGVRLDYQNLIDNMTITVANAFTVPSKRKERDLIVVTQTNNQNTTTKYIGYQVKNLTNSTMYRFQYTVGNETSNTVDATTTKAIPYTSINDSLPGRSGAMVVITVILAVTTFLLIVGLVITLVFAHCMK